MLIAVFQAGVAQYYAEYQVVEDLYGVNYIIAHHENEYFDIYVTSSSFDEERVFGRRADQTFLKVREKSGFARLFRWDKEEQMHFEVCQGYDFSPFENAFVYNIKYDHMKGTRVVVFNNNKILGDETGVLVTNCDKGVILADRFVEPRRYFCWRAGVVRPQRLKSGLVSYDEFYRPRGFFYRFWKSLFKRFIS